MDFPPNAGEAARPDHSAHWRPATRLPGMRLFPLPAAAVTEAHGTVDAPTDLALLSSMDGLRAPRLPDGRCRSPSTWQCPGHAQELKSDPRWTDRPNSDPPKPTGEAVLK